MAHETAYIDLNSKPDLARVARELARTGGRVVLREDGMDLAVLSPARPKRRLRGKRPTQADIDAALATFGAWKEIDRYPAPPARRGAQ